MSFECFVFGCVPVLYIDQKISNGFSLILLRGFAHANLPLTQLCETALNSSTYLCNLGCSSWCERPSLVSFTCADFQWFLILTSELKKTKRLIIIIYFWWNQKRITWLICSLHSMQWIAEYSEENLLLIHSPEWIHSHLSPLKGGPTSLTLSN